MKEDNLSIFKVKFVALTNNKLSIKRVILSNSKDVKSEFFVENICTNVKTLVVLLIIYGFDLLQVIIFIDVKNVFIQLLPFIEFHFHWILKDDFDISRRPNNKSILLSIGEEITWLLNQLRFKLEHLIHSFINQVQSEDFKLGNEEHVSSLLIIRHASRFFKEELGTHFVKLIDFFNKNTLFEIKTSKTAILVTLNCVQEQLVCLLLASDKVFACNHTKLSVVLAL